MCVSAVRGAGPGGWEHERARLACVDASSQFVKAAAAMVLITLAVLVMPILLVSVVVGADLKGSRERGVDGAWVQGDGNAAAPLEF